MKTKQPDYEALFKEALVHLRVMTGSRNSFSPEAQDRLLHPKDVNAPPINFRNPIVEQMHMDALKFVKEHDK